MLSSKFRRNHGDVDFYLHTFARSNCAMRPFSKRCRPEFKATPVQRESDFHFHFGRDSNFDHAKVIPGRATPLRDIGALGRLKTLHNPSGRISHRMCCSASPFEGRKQESPKCSSFQTAGLIHVFSSAGCVFDIK